MMLVCLKNHEFEQVHCSKEIDAFVECNKKYEVINYFIISVWLVVTFFSNELLLLKLIMNN